MAKEGESVDGVTDSGVSIGAADGAKAAASGNSNSNSARATSERHAGILNDYKNETSPFFDWVRDRLGDVRLDDWDWGQANFSWTIDDRYIVGDGFTFGGHIAAVADHVAAVVAMTALSDVDDRFRTGRLDTQFFRPVTKPSARIEARVVNISRSLVNVEADFFTAKNKLAVRIAATQVRTRAK
ncbi:MAG: hotdog domain-containing protein [Pseudomonadota bacterium]